MKQNRASIYYYDQLINSRKGSAHSSNVGQQPQDQDGTNNSNIHSEQSQNDIDDVSQSKSFSQTLSQPLMTNFTVKLQRERQMNSQNQIYKAFNSIRDMKNKDQINKALLMVSQVKDRVVLIEKLLVRREQIAKAKEMQAINNLAPLFNKIKSKLLNSLEKRNDETSAALKKLNKQDTCNQVTQNDNRSEAQSSQAIGSTSQSQLTNDINHNPIQKQRSPTRIKTGTNSIIPQQPVNQIPDYQKGQASEEDQNAIQQQNKNVIGAITIFATHDIRMDSHNDENDKKQKHKQLLGYLQKDQLLRQDDRLKSPMKSSKRKSNGNSTASGLIGISNNSGNTQNPMQNSTGQQGSNNTGKQTKKQNERAQSVSTIIPNQSPTATGIDYTQKMQELKKKMFQVGQSGVGRRDSPQNSPHKAFRVRSQNGSSPSIYKQGNIDSVKEDFSSAYFFKSQSQNFTQAAEQGIRNHSNSSSATLNNNTFNSQMYSLHKRSSTQKQQSNDGVLFDFILECEQKRFIKNNPSLNCDPLFAKRLHLKSQGSPKTIAPFKTSIVPSKKIQIRSNENNGSVLDKIYFMRRQYSSQINSPIYNQFFNLKTQLRNKQSFLENLPTHQKSPIL